MGRAVEAFVVERLGVFSGQPERHVDPRKGTSKYPFDALEVGHALRVMGRDKSTVRSAVKRWVGLEKSRKAWRFQVWRSTFEGKRCVLVKRIK